MEKNLKEYATIRVELSTYKRLLSLKEKNPEMSRSKIIDMIVDSYNREETEFQRIKERIIVGCKEGDLKGE